MSAKNSGDFLLLKVDSLETAMSLATEKYTELAASAPLRGNGNQSNLFFDGKGWTLTLSKQIDQVVVGFITTQSSLTGTSLNGKYFVFSYGD